MAKEARGDFYPVPIVDQNTRPGAVTRLIVFIVVLTGAAIVFGLFRERLGDPFLLGMLGVLAMIGVGFLFATAIGFVQIAPRSTGDELSKAFVDSMSQGLLVTDTKGRVVYANRAYADMTGAASAADLKTVEGLLSDVPEASMTIYRLASGLRDGQAGDGEFRLAQSIKPGAEPGARWYRARARAFSMPGQRLPMLAWQLADISQERAEQERFFLDLQKAIDHLDHAPAGFFSADQEGRVTYINATLAEWLGIDLASFTPGAITLPEIIAGDGMALVRSVKADPGTTRNAVIDLDLTTMSGQALPVRFMHRVSASREGVNGPTRTIVLNRTQGEDASAELRASEVRFTRFFNSTPMAIAGVDANGRILRTNAPFLQLFSSVVDRDAVDRRVRFETIVHERDRPAFAAAFEKARQRQANIEPIDSVLPGNEERHIRFYVNAVADTAGGEGAEESAIVYAVETTEQKALEGQMAQSQKMQAVGQLAGGIAHDFNNVLTAIIMASDLLLTNHRPSDPSFPDIMNIKQNANRAASLVRQLLAFSRKQTLRPEVLSLTDVLADLRMLLARLVGNDIKLKIDHGRDLWPVKVDIGQFEQVVVNLAVNARDAMPGGGDLTVRTRNVTLDECKSFAYRELTPADYVLVDVEDTGSGIAPDVLKKIFEPFFTTKEVGKGTGLGLSMVYGIIKQTGGFIFCDSEVGKGTVFRIFLPRHIAEVKKQAEPGEAPVTVAAPAKPADTAKDLSGSATVLLVEDEDAVRMGGVRALTSRGYTVHEASSGVEALEVFEALGGKVDIVVSDVVMPEMDGPTLLGELRKRQPGIKFVFVSGYAEDAFAKNLPADAHFGFLPKPFSLKQLATIVKDVLES
ncbi:MAG: response regulator [Mesorhizobium sp.]|jgi:two-component system cell cycle sensor histidine kinase/response regulator CckA|uniref:cell cycle histidine kinase CckA n=2 Tax=Mesorhizobium sp. TaxID=1871066 RepID=UPI000FE3416C|nr:PAS domain-containing sensor histidine kinase [Mesorhizobium sp.]RWH75701.1 MAG: PAS domain-containing sensor histidine kinase [Mesorhizobium sp.]RWL28801.1 MAG: PAS domain-containing sensor histidine kinase [Mesorhizobium sp.]RWL30746.1 MAG: PAS domain-containing sensor histidine kinase [Mesorhizobium sp.]RWL37483.1 MAG: PAS domain-containing sensor histidine kinase [Mesorhizobium sp.]RWL45145.1 MAG: PAS domain-containing sensor histidine kinase [Mesorhizobium sp.]